MNLLRNPGEADGAADPCRYLYDETELYNYKQAITDQKMVAGLIYLDNYDEALESVRKSADRS